jgi:hypothetical protein
MPANTNQPADLYNTPTNYRVALVPIHFKVGTHSSSIYLVRKKDLKFLVPGGQLRIFTERYDNGITVLIEECRFTGIGELWVCEKF